jgi:hypothetical protein
VNRRRASEFRTSLPTDLLIDVGKFLSSAGNHLDFVARFSLAVCAFCPPMHHSTPILKINLSQLIWIPLASYCEMTIWEELRMTTVDLGRNGSMNLKL